MPVRAKGALRIDDRDVNEAGSNTLPDAPARGQIQCDRVLARICHTTGKRVDSPGWISNTESLESITQSPTEYE